MRFDSMSELDRACAAGEINFGIDNTGIVQEFLPARGGHIVRVETLAGKFLYAIKVYTSAESFNLCPAELCRIEEGSSAGAPADAPKAGLKVEPYTPPPQVIEAVEVIVGAAKIDVGGIEYIVDDRDGSVVYYDVNALSNFVANAPEIVGFDPHQRLVDYLKKEMEAI